MTARLCIAAFAAALFAASVFSPGAAAPPHKLPRTSGEMQREAIAREGRSPKPAAALVTARRCGWLSNPTPGNWWLFDGHGEWILATQGGPQARGFDDMPDMSRAGWVETNGHHGFGCACMTLTYDAPTLRVARIAAARPKPLKQCRADRTLPRP